MQFAVKEWLLSKTEGFPGGSAGKEKLNHFGAGQAGVPPVHTSVSTDPGLYLLLDILSSLRGCWFQGCKVKRNICGYRGPGRFQKKGF